MKNANNHNRINSVHVNNINLNTEYYSSSKY